MVKLNGSALPMNCLNHEKVGAIVLQCSFSSMELSSSVRRSLKENLEKSRLFITVALLIRKSIMVSGTCSTEKYAFFS